MSRCLTCASSWPSTPSSSSSVSIRRMPSVAATAACSGLRPVANAFGDGIGNDVAARLRQAGPLAPADRRRRTGDGRGRPPARCTCAARSCPRTSTRRSWSRRRRGSRSPCPPAPPSASPMNISSALIVPSSSAVFTVLFMGCSQRPRGRDRYSSPRDQARDERGAIRQRLDLDMFVQRVRAVADRAEAVERRNPERGSEIPVRAAAGAALRQLLSRAPARRPRLSVQTLDQRGAFQRRPVDAAATPRPSCGSSTGRRPRNAASISAAAAAVGTRTSTVARASSGITFERRPPDTCTTLTEMPCAEILQRVDAQNLVRQLLHGARAFLRLDAGVRRDAADDDLVLAAALARRLHRAARAATARAPARRGCGALRPRSPRATSRCRPPRRSSRA